MTMKEYSAVVTKEDAWHVALNPETGVASQGKTVEEALSNLREALELYLEEIGDDSRPESQEPPLLTTVKV